MQLNVTFSEGNLSNIAISATSVTFTASWASTTADVRITRNATGYIYEDIGFFTRTFDNVSSLCWEFNYQESLLGPILEGLTPTTLPDVATTLTNQGKSWLDNHVLQALGQARRNSNYTKPRNRKKKK